MVLQGANISVLKFKKKRRNHWKRHRFEWVFIESEVSKAESPPLHHCRAGEFDFNGSGLRAALFPASLTRKQLGVPEIVRGRVSVVCVVFPVSAAVGGCGGKCLSVHLQVHQFVA